MSERDYFAQFAAWDTEADFADRAEAWLNSHGIYPSQMIAESDTTCSAIVTMQEYIDSTEIAFDTYAIVDHDTLDINRVEIFIWHFATWLTYNNASAKNDDYTPGRLMRTWRLDINLSQRQFAKLSQIDLWRYMDIENQRIAPTPAEFERILVAFEQADAQARQQKGVGDGR